MGNVSYMLFIDSIKALNIPLKGEVGFYELLINYNNYLSSKGMNKKLSIEDEIYIIKGQLMEYKSLLDKMEKDNINLQKKLDDILKDIDNCYIKNKCYKLTPRSIK